MATLPVISGRAAVTTFEKLGFVFHRQKGSHIILYNPNGRHRRCPIIESSIEETLRALIRGAGITVEQFVALI